MEVCPEPSRRSTTPYDSCFSTKIYDKRDVINYDTVYFSFSDNDIPRFKTFVVYISKLIRLLQLMPLTFDITSKIRLWISYNA